MMLIITFTILVYHLRTITCSDGDEVGCWPNNIIPFRILPGFNENQKHLIYDTIGEFHRSTCIRWVDEDKVPNNAPDRVVFQNVEKRSVCRIRKERVRARNITLIELGDACFVKRVLMHEMMHVLGFAHEHQRADRNCYVSVDYRQSEVPLPADEYDIKHIRWLERFPYDKHSNTHHPASVALKVNPRRGKPYILPTKYSDEPLGNETGELTPLDLWKILFKFCGFPHFCDFFPQLCVFMDESELTCAKHQDFKVTKLFRSPKSLN